MPIKKTTMACTQCGSRNYSKSVNPGNRTERLELNKFCKHCKTHTLHKETK